MKHFLLGVHDGHRTALVWGAGGLREGLSKKMLGKCNMLDGGVNR